MQTEAVEEEWIDVTDDITVVREVREVKMQDGQMAARVHHGPPPIPKALTLLPSVPPSVSADPFFRAVTVVIDQMREVLAGRGMRKMEIELVEWNLRERIAKLP